MNGAFEVYVIMEEGERYLVHQRNNTRNDHDISYEEIPKIIDRIHIAKQ